MPVADFEAKLGQYADVIVQIGLGLQPGQKLIINATIEAVDLVREVTRRAYQAGARYVDVLWDDEVLTLLRLQNANPDTLEEYPVYRAEAFAAHARNGDAYLGILARNPDLLSGEDPNAVMTLQRTAAKHLQPFGQLVSSDHLNWLGVAAPTRAWAAKVFPDVPADQQMDRMWEAVFEMARINHPDPVAGWKEHIQRLAELSETLNRKRYAALHLTGPGTDLTVGLADGHRWVAGATRTPSGIEFTANIPTEEAFTAPHRERVNGVVRATKPLNYQGMLIDDFSVTFNEGRVTDIQAGQGGEVLQKLITMDEGAARLGEIALVPHSSPISRFGRLFYNTLYDENASNHIALGRAYASNLEDGESLSADDLLARGLNNSLIHVDFMIGSDQTDVDGIRSDGSSEAVMRAGEWAI